MTSANTSPIYTLTPHISWGKLTTADATQDGTGANVVSIFTGGTYGSFVYKIVFQPISTSGSITTNAAAGRVYINNGSTIGTAANNTLYAEESLTAQAVSQTGTTGAYKFEVPINFQIPANYVIACSATSFASNSAYQVCVIGGDY